MGNDDSTNNLLNAFNTLVTQLISIGVNMDEYHCLTLLCSLVNSKENLVMIIRSRSEAL
jgi:hypothetical protein